MKRNVWKQRYPVTSVRAYVRAATGKEIEEITKDIGHAFKRFPEVKEALLEAARTGRHVTIVADYDADGVDSAIIMYKLCLALGIKCSIIMPKRFSEGYGLSDKILERIPDGDLLITIDNGITCIDQIKAAKERGMFVIVLDHHQAVKDPETGELILPEADIIIDPSAIGEADFTCYCGAGIGYRLACYMLGEDHPLIDEISVNAMFGTIADCMELSGDNRKIVTRGLESLAAGKCTPAVTDLCNKSKINKVSTATDIAFNVAPVLNAPGRLYDDGAEKVVSALILGKERVDAIIQDNETRKKIVETTMEKLDIEALKNSDDHIIIHCDETIPEGIVGIVAGKISEGTGKPVICLTADKEHGGLKGSARSPREDFSLVEVLSAHKDLLVRVGGHAKAAGLAILPENLEAFKKALNEDIPAAEGKDDALYWDLQIDSIRFPEMAKQILNLEPTGEGLPAPVVRIKTRVKSNGMQRIGGKKEEVINPETGEPVIDPETGKPMVNEIPPKHIKFDCDNFTAIAFNDVDWANEQLKYVPRPRYVDMIGRLCKNWYKSPKTGKEYESIQIIITDFELS